MMKNYIVTTLTGLCWLCCLSCLFISCSDESEAESEWDNWQERNDAKTAEWAANTSLRKIKCFSKDQTTVGKASDYIYVQVLESGSGTECPLYTDTVRVAYRGRLIPSTTYPEGYVFDQSFIGDFDWKTVSVYTNTTTGVDRATAGNWMDGFTTAIQNMHKGDYWRVYIPYDLMYGSASGTTYPAYSNMIFDIALVDIWHPGETRPLFRARQK